MYATGLYETVAVEATPVSGGVALTFQGKPRTFIGSVSVGGARGATINTQLDRASQLEPGTRLNQAKLDQANADMRQTLAENGYKEPRIEHTLTPHPADQLVDIAFQVTSGPQSRIGAVQVSGDPGIDRKSVV